MKISVVIPVYNGEQYISACLLSLLNQTYMDWEAILINDGSIDNSLAILYSFSKKDARFVVHDQENGGAALARAVGIKKVMGDYVTFLDIDDTLSPNYMEKLIAHFESPDVDIVAASFNIIQNGNIIKKKHLKQETLNNVEHLRKVLTGRCGWELCAKMYRKELFDTYINVPEYIRIGEDAAIYIQLVMYARKVSVIDEPLYNYIQYDSSASHVRSIEYANDTLQAAFYINSLLKEKAFYQKIYNEVAAMFLLFYSNSTRKARLGLKHPLVHEIYDKYYSLKAIKLLPRLKGVYVALSFIAEKIVR